MSFRSLFIRFFLSSLSTCVLHKVAVARSDFYLSPKNPPTNWAGEPHDYSPRLSGNRETTLYKISIKKDGIYRIPMSLLQESGIVSNTVLGSQLKLYNKGNALFPITSNDGIWNENDYLLFWGEKLTSSYSDENVYWLGIDKNLAPTPQSLIKNGRPFLSLPEINTSAEHILYQPENTYLSRFRPIDDAHDHWFANVILPQGRYENLNPSIPATLSHLISSENARIGVAVASPELNRNRKIRVDVNGETIGTLTCKGESIEITTMEFPADYLNSGKNNFKFLDLSGKTDLDYSLLEGFEVIYPRKLEARQGKLRFQGIEGANNYRVNGFSTPSISLFDISNPLAPSLIGNSRIEYHNTKYSLTFGALTFENTSYFAIEKTKITNITKLMPVTFPGLADQDQQADYLIITTPPLAKGANRLATHRSQQGLSTRVVFDEDIYNEFNYGIRDAKAIRNFLGYVFHHWKMPIVRYVLLIGDATFDPKGIKNLKKPTDLTTRMGKGTVEYSPRDSWFGAVNGDDLLSDIAVGRIPVSSSSSLDLVIDKIISFESANPKASWRKRSLWVTDKSEETPGDSGDEFSNNFKHLAKSLMLEHFTPTAQTCTQAHLDDTPGAIIESTIINTFNQGALTINYFGHGNTTFWSHWKAGQYLFTSENASELQNTLFPIITSWACETGYFHHPSEESLAETSLEQANGGVAFIGSSEECFARISKALATGFYDALLRKKTYRLGDAYQNGLKTLWALTPNTPALQTYHLFGDPALIVNPITNSETDSDSDGMPDGWEIQHALEPYINDGNNDPDGDSISNLDEFINSTDPQENENPPPPQTAPQDRPEPPETPSLPLDTDLDHLPDDWEEQHGLDPYTAETNPDPDEDGLHSAWEYYLDTHPMDEDTDKDLLSDGDEYNIFGTDPKQNDSDNDGLLDGAEIHTYGTDPLDSDTDNDGISDAEEVDAQLDPTLTDTDGDTLPDGYELTYNLNPLDSTDTQEDPDQDGLTNLEEYSYGTSPISRDTDNDNLDDGAELNTYNTNPLNKDTDKDTLNDHYEIFFLKTDPNSWDTDKDTMSDSFENFYGLDPLDPTDANEDSDGDGLLNVLEVASLYTNPTRKDTDGDGLEDGYEVDHGYSPRMRDQDSDGLIDGLEVLKYNTNPTLSDTDGDGLSDGDEINIYLTNPTQTDSDGDTIDDGFEVSSGMDPTVRSDIIRVGVTHQNNGDGLNLIWNCMPNKSYTVLNCTNLINDSFHVLYTNISANLPHNQIEIPTKLRMGFFKVIEE